MKHMKKFSVVLSVFVMFMFAAVQFAAVPMAHAAGTIYYVSQSGGSDSNNGTSASTPWQTMAKVSSITFVAGDQILLKRGDVWNEYLQMHGSGTSTNFITLSAYGTGSARPMIQRNGAISDRTIRWASASYIKVASIAVANAGMGIWLDGVQSNYVDDCLVYNVKGLYGTAQAEGTLWSVGIQAGGPDSRITNSEVWGGGGAGIGAGGAGAMVTKVYIHDQNDATTSYAGMDYQGNGGTITGALFDNSVYAAAAGTSAIMFKNQQGTSSVPTLIHNSIIRNTPHSGTHDEVGIDFEDNNNYVTIDNVAFENNAGPAIEFLAIGSYNIPSSHVEIKNSQFIRDDWAKTQSQTSPGEIEAVMAGATNITIHDNLYTLASGINFFGGAYSGSGGYTLTNNTSSGSITYNHEPSVNAGADKNVTGTSVSLSDASVSDDGGSPAVTWEQYSGPGIVTFANPNTANTTATLPVSGTYVLRLVGDDGTYFKSDYVTVTSGTGPVLANAGFESPSTSTYTYGPFTNGWTFGVGSGVQHNGGGFGASTAPEGVQTALIQNGGQMSQSVTFTAGSYTVGFQAAKRLGYGTQSFDVYYDTTVIGSYTPSSGSFTSFTTNNFTAAAGSHTIKFVGTNTVGDNTDFIDAVTIQAVGGLSTTVDDMSDYSKIFSHSANLTFDGSNSAYLGGDTTRLTRTTSTNESIVYQANSGMLSFSTDTWFWPNEATVDFKFYTSPDNSTYTELTPAQTIINGTYPSWNKIIYSGNVTAGTKYLKIEFRNTSANNWNPQIGSVSITSNSSSVPTLANSGFETPTTTNYTYGPLTNGWTFGSGTGVQKNGSDFGASTAPEGIQTALIQGGGQISQSVTFAAGSYTVSFQAAKRTTFGGTESFDVYYDTTVIGSFTPSSGSFVTFTTSSFTATAGSHTIKFVGTNTVGDNTDFIDAVAIN